MAFPENLQFIRARAGLTQEQLAHTLFPLGGLEKTQVRQLAEAHGLVNAHKHDSQDICFIPDGDYRRFIEETTGQKSTPGNFVDQEGNVLGTHKGYYCYTIGQRRGLGISAPQSLYVVEIRPEKNEVVLGSNEDLFHSHLTADHFNWIEQVGPDEIIKARIRYHQIEKEATTRILEDGKVEVDFLEPQRAITKGQSVVLYRGDAVAGGGRIIG